MFNKTDREIKLICKKCNKSWFFTNPEFRYYVRLKKWGMNLKELYPEIEPISNGKEGLIICSECK